MIEKINPYSKKIISNVILSVVTIFSFIFTSAIPLSAHAASMPIEVWWPTSGAHLQGVQPFKAVVTGLDASQYDMLWEVDGGKWNVMDTSSVGYPHKEASVDVTAWNWHGNGPYSINFIARKNGVIIGQQSVAVYIDPVSTASFTPAPAPQLAPTPAPSPLPTPNITQNPVQDIKLYVDPNSKAAQQKSVWQNYPTGSSAMNLLATQPTAKWFGDWNSNVQNDVRALVSAATNQNTAALLVAYNIPQRDCGGYSSGGSNNPDGYINWITNLAQGIGSGKAIVILEPDALSQMGCLSSNDQSTRLSLISQATSILKRNANTKVYIDAGHSNWIEAGVMGQRLNDAGIKNADGFAVNVSNFISTNNEAQYGGDVSQKVGGKHFIIDTSRNGAGSNGQWCNPTGSAIGPTPTSASGNPLIDAYLWLKVPGESDGYCNGGPGAGTWWPDYAVKLVQNAQH